jgi:DtxR family Mn-dependent transcriptional regulator
MDELLGYPKFDPHGSPIPDKKGRMIWATYSKLSECRQDDIVKIAAVVNTSDEFLRFLNSREIHLGLEMKIKSVESFDNSMVVNYDKHLSEMLSHTVCERLLVEKI